jgi:ADP-ribose pyrophosphatase
MSDSLEEKTIRRNDIFSGRVINVHVDEIMLPDGKLSKREVVDHCKGVCVLALDSEGGIYLVEQYRYPVEKQIYEIPAGKVEEGEDVFECATRELSEEIGAEGRDYEFLGSFYVSPGFTNEEIFMYFCRIEKMGDNHLDEGEFLNVYRFCKEEIYSLIDSHEIKDGKTILAFYMAVSRGLI